MKRPKGTISAGACSHYSPPQPDATADSTRQWWVTLASALLARKGLIRILFSLFLPSPMQIPHRTSYVVPLELNMWVSHLEIRFHDSRNDPLSPKSHPVLCQLKGMPHGHTGLYWKCCWAVMPQSKISAHGPWFAPSLDTTFLWSHWERQKHKMNISKTDECVHTVKCNSLGSVCCKSRCTKWSSPAFPQWLSDRKELSENKCSYQITGIDFLS